MRKIVCFSLVSIFFLSVSAQKTVYDANAQLRNVTDFTAIKVSGGIDLYVSAGDEAVAVSGSKSEYVERIKTEITNGVLKIWYDAEGLKAYMGGADKKLKAYVSYKTLKALSASGGSDVVVDGEITTDKLSLKISGGSDFSGKINVQELEVEQSGGSDIVISGNAAMVNIVASGGSDFNGYSLITDTCTAKSSGGSDVEITVNKELSAEAHGASDIHYKGNPSIKSKKTAGASSVSRKS